MGLNLFAEARSFRAVHRPALAGVERLVPVFPSFCRREAEEEATAASLAASGMASDRSLTSERVKTG